MSDIGAVILLLLIILLAALPTYLVRRKEKEEEKPSTKASSMTGPSQEGQRDLPKNVKEEEALVSFVRELTNKEKREIKNLIREEMEKDGAEFRLFEEIAAKVSGRLAKMGVLDSLAISKEGFKAMYKELEKMGV